MRMKIILLTLFSAASFFSCAGKSGPAAAADEPEDTQGPISIAGTSFSFTTDFTKYSIEADEVMSGGPQKDGIPAVDEPRFVDIRDADQWIGDNEPVIILRTGDTVKIYPIQILMYHEIVNDVLKDTPVAVTYCPLCNTSIVFKAEVDGRRLDFGTTGRLRYSNLLMYDRQTESWWQQASGTAVIGDFTGKVLEIVPSLMLSWEAAAERYPGAMVLSRDTGYSRPYGSNPYVGYDSGSPWAYRGPGLPDDDYAMRRAMVVRIGGEEEIFLYHEIEADKVVSARVGNKEIVLFWDGSQASPLDTGNIYQGRLVGGVNAFYTDTASSSLNFEMKDGKISDIATGSTWSVDGVALEGRLTGERLEPAPAIHHFWFSAYVFSELGL